MAIDEDDMWKSALFSAAMHSTITYTFLNQKERNDNGYKKAEGLTVSDSNVTNSRNKGDIYDNCTR